MKKILITAYDLNLGGIETSLVNLIKNLDVYDITLVLEKKEGIFLDQIPKNVHIIEYKVYKNRFTIFRKIFNRIKLIRFTSKIRNKYFFSCSFATYSIPGAHIALSASKNNALWLHANYYKLYNESETDMKKFLDSVFITKFKKNIYVSSENKREIISHYPILKSKAIVCNNIIDYKQIIKNSNELINEKKESKILFVNVGRHEEKQKRIIRIIEACKKLKKQKYDFQMIFVGEGPDTNYYQEYVKKNKLEDTIKFVGKKKNPYPYIKLSDAIVLSSTYEGYPVVFHEAMILNKPIISTKVSDYEEIENKYGIFCNNDDNSIYYAMKKFLDENFLIKEKFNCEKYNTEIKNKINDIINNNI